MNIENELKKYTDFVPIEQLRKCIERPLALCPGELKYIIPSLIMGGDGPVLQSLLLLTSDTLCEIRLKPQAESFDFVSLSIGILNYRFELSEHIVKKEIKNEESVNKNEASNESKVSKENTEAGEIKKYEVCKILLRHSISGLGTDINYVGNDRESWLKQVVEAFPISMIFKPLLTS